MSANVKLDQVIKKSETGLIFYRKCSIDGIAFNVGHNVLISDEGRLKLAYLLKIYCRTKGNERALVRWFFTDEDFPNNITQQHCPHEVFATSYTGKVAVATIKKMLHVVWVADKDEIPAEAPDDVYYSYRYFDHDKQALVPHRSQLLQMKYMPKPIPDNVGSSLSVKDSTENLIKPPNIKFLLPYTQGGSTFFKVCLVGKEKYKIGDCVLLANRDGSSIRRIISFSYNHEQRPIANGQFIYYQNEVTLSHEQRANLHYQEVLVSNWRREFLISNVKKKIIVIHQNIFQPVPEDALKALYFLKRYYDPFKKRICPLSEPLTRSDFSVVPAPLIECPNTPKLSHIVKNEDDVTFYKDCQVGDGSFSVGDFVTLQSGSVCVRVQKLYHDQNAQPIMTVNKLFTIRNVPSSERPLLTTGLLFSEEVYENVSCSLFFERMTVVFHPDDVTSENTFVAGDFFNAESKEVFRLRKPAKTLGAEDIPQPGASLRDDAETSSSEEESSDEEEESSSGEEEKKTDSADLSHVCDEDFEDKDFKWKDAKNKTSDDESSKRRGRKRLKRDQIERSKVLEFKRKEEETKKLKELQKEEAELITPLLKRIIVLLDEGGEENQYLGVKVDNVEARVGDVFFVKLVEGIQMGRIMSIYRDHDDIIRLKMFRFYLEEEMFVSKRESATIHVNECFATDFVIHALAYQLEEKLDVVFLKKKEKIPLEIPKGRLFVRRYYHPLRHILRSLVEPLSTDDMTIIPTPHPPISVKKGEKKTLNHLPRHPTKSKDVVTEPPSTEEKSEESNNVAENNTSPHHEPSSKSVVSGSKSEELTRTNDTTITEKVVNKISIVSESEVSEHSMTILPENMISFSIADTNSNPSIPCSEPQIQIVQNSTFEQTSIQVIQSDKNDADGKNCIQIVPTSADQALSVPIEIVPSTEKPNQIQIVGGDSTQIQVVSANDSSMQIIPSSESTQSTTPFLPTILSSEQEMESEMNIDISHAADGCITIAPMAGGRATAKLEDSYTKDGRVYYKKCQYKDETFLRGDTIYVRCGNDANIPEGEESWKLGRVLEFYHSKVPVVRLLWFYVVEEMVTSKKERDTIHPQEVFASQCDDEIEVTSIESKATIIFLKEREGIPKNSDNTGGDESALYCRRFYDPYKHMIRALKTRLSAEDPSIMPEPLIPGQRRKSVKNKDCPLGGKRKITDTPDRSSGRKRPARSANSSISEESSPLQMHDAQSPGTGHKVDADVSNVGASVLKSGVEDADMKVGETGQDERETISITCPLVSQITSPPMTQETIIDSVSDVATQSSTTAGDGESLADSQSSQTADNMTGTTMEGVGEKKIENFAEKTIVGESAEATVSENAEGLDSVNGQDIDKTATDDQNIDSTVTQ